MVIYTYRTKFKNSTVLWNIEFNNQKKVLAINPTRDNVGKYAKFNTPVVVNGRAYLATFSNTLNVYGLLSQTTKKLPAPWNNGDVGNTSVAGNVNSTMPLSSVRKKGMCNACICSMVFA